MLSFLYSYIIIIIRQTQSSANPCVLIGSFSVRILQYGTVSMETVQSVYFCSEAKPANSNLATKTAKKKVWILSFFTLKVPEEAKKIEIFLKFQRWMEKTNMFKCKPSEVHFTIRNRVPYNKQLTNLACSSRTVEYWPSVIFVRTLDQHSQVRPSRSVSKRLLFTNT